MQGEGVAPALEVFAPFFCGDGFGDGLAVVVAIVGGDVVVVEDGVARDESVFEILGAVGVSWVVCGFVFFVACRHGKKTQKSGQKKCLFHFFISFGCEKITIKYKFSVNYQVIIIDYQIVKDTLFFIILIYFFC